MKSYPPPRESQLRKAALTLLAAATAAFFVCAPAGAVVEIETIEITQMTVSATDIVEGDSHTTTASLIAKPGRILGDLDNRVVRVEWTVEADGDDDPEHEWTDNNPGVSSDFTFTYDSLGSTTGSAVVVKAVAFDALGDSDTAETTINVWTKSETVNIVSKTSDQTLVGAATTNVSVQTDVGFYRVDWSVDDGSGGSATAITTNGPGLTSQIAYDFSTVPHGNTVTFTATPYGVNADGEAVAGEAASIEIVAWKIISIDYCTPSPFSAKVVEGEELFVYAYTNIPFSRIEYSVEHGDTYTDPSDGANDTESQFSHTFNNLPPDNDLVEGHERDIVVTAYATINGEEFKSDPVTVEATVYYDNGYVWKSIEASIDSFEQIDGNQYKQTTSHSVVYYNDDANLPQVDFLGRIGWWMGNERANMLLILGQRHDDPISLELAYSATFSVSLTSSRILSRNRYYGGHAFTRFSNLRDPHRGDVEVNKISDVRYKGDGVGLPPTGSETNPNDSRKAKLLAD